MNKLSMKKENALKGKLRGKNERDIRELTKAERNRYL